MAKVVFKARLESSRHWMVALQGLKTFSEELLVLLRFSAPLKNCTCFGLPQLRHPVDLNELLGSILIGKIKKSFRWLSVNASFASVLQFL